MNFQETGSYNLLKKHSVFLNDILIKDLFLDNPKRFEEFSTSLGDIVFDYSKNQLDKKAVDYLIKMAQNLDLKSKIHDMFDGVKINFTEKRAVLHTALRDNLTKSIKVDGVNVIDDIKKNFDAMVEFVNSVRDGKFRGTTGERILDVVNIGIGGSYLGAKMAIEALKPYKTPLINFHFISNIDGTDISEVLKKIEPETTLFVVASKTFTTDETMTNANSAKKWLVEKLGEKAVKNHFCALSTNKKLAGEFGIPESQVFPFGDYVGGRYSMWGTIGLPICMAIGVDNFKKFLGGANLADEHFKNTDFDKNIPVLMALVSIWNINFMGVVAEAVLPYDNYLKYLPLYLQQLVMESNGKSVDKNGSPIKYQTSPIIFGDEGTNGQHSFYQLLHQGTEKILCDFIIPVFSHNEIGEHQLKLLANGIAQTEALMKGKTKAEAEAELRAQGMSDAEIQKLLPYKEFTGNRPSNTFLIKRITPETLGMLVAFYEHKTFVEGVFWDINSFDQFGVELGKQLAKNIVRDLKSDEIITSHDSSTNGLINMVKTLREDS
ncbi:glucose-6-phosphate isomerase [bacterium]|nr:glucose-6-phosphate isomerase [bacterium]